MKDNVVKIGSDIIDGPNWQNLALSSLLLDSFSGGTPSREKREYYENGNIPWIKSGELNQVYITSTEEKITSEGIKKSAAKIVPRETLLYALYGATAGIVAISGIDAAINQAILALFPNENLIRKKYLFHYLTHFKEKILSEFTQGGQPNLSGSIVLSLGIRFPSILLQDKIVKLLDTWDSALSLTTELIKRKELQKKWLMREVMTQCFAKDSKGSSKKDKSVCMRYTYGDVLKVVKRPVEWNDDVVYDLISVRRRSGGIFQRESLKGNQIKVKDLRTAKEGDFLFSKMQIVHGASALVKREFDGAKISGSYIAVVAKDPEVLDMEFFDWLSKTKYFYHQTYISSYGVHIEKMTFDFESFLSIGIHLPKLSVQRKAISVLSTAEVEIQILTKKLELLREQKKGLMQVLLSGKKRLKIRKA